MLSEKELLSIKDDIDKAKAKVHELTGRQKYLLEELKSKWKCSSVEEAQKELERLEKEISQLDTKIKKGMYEVEEKYNVK